ncbi:MAG TPA: hypothetical protein VFD59_04915 [Nocardioidaceae bacterium]|nr:hypothetical protein [Nocardioidaceae bacterium]
MVTEFIRELEAPAELVDELAAVLGEGQSEVNPDLRVQVVSSNQSERAVDPATLALLILTLIGGVNDVADFRRNIGEGLRRWRRRFRPGPGQHAVIDVRVRRGGTDEYHRLSGEMSDEDLDAFRDTLADLLR